MLTTPLRRLWWRWKSLKLPWRRKHLIGADLAGNTFWEMKVADSLSRPRRIVQSARRVHYGDIQISPPWHQWLRYTRLEAPSTEEQLRDVRRQADIKRLARLADERWASKPSLLDPPELKNAAPETKVKDTGAYPAPVPGASRRQGVAGEDWRPQAWSPAAGPAKGGA